MPSKYSPDKTKKFVARKAFTRQEIGNDATSIKQKNLNHQKDDAKKFQNSIEKFLISTPRRRQYKTLVSAYSGNLTEVIGLLKKYLNQKTKRVGNTQNSDHKHLIDAFLLLDRLLQEIEPSNCIANAEAFLRTGIADHIGLERLALAFWRAGNPIGTCWAAGEAVKRRPSPRTCGLLAAGMLSTAYASARQWLRPASREHHQLARPPLGPYREAGGTDPVPVFLCGYPKSGTTLLVSLLDYHPEAVVFPEETAYFRLLRKRRWENRWLSHSLQAMLDHPKLRHLDDATPSDGGGERDYRGFDYEEFRRRAQSLWLGLLSTRSRANAIIMEAIVRAYGQTIGYRNTKVWAEKTPLNECFLPLIKRTWPNAKAIYVIRNPWDNYISYCKKRSKENLSLSPEDFHALWSRSLRYWENFSGNYPSDALLIRYEDLTSHPEREMRRVADFLEISWTEGLLTPTRAGRLWAGNSQYDQKFTDISRSSVGVALRRLDEKTGAILTELCRRDIAEYYPDAAELGFSAFAPSDAPKQAPNGISQPDR